MSRMLILSPEGPDRAGAAGPAPAHRLPGLTGRLIAIHDNSKPGATEILGPMADTLAGSGARIRRWSKAHAARPSPHIEEMATAVHAAVFALGG